MSAIDGAAGPSRPHPTRRKALSRVGNQGRARVAFRGHMYRLDRAGARCVKLPDFEPSPGHHRSADVICPATRPRRVAQQWVL